MDGFIIYLIGVLIWSVIWGFVTKSINENKGYYGGFWWGFFLSWIGLIVVACKPNNISSYSNTSQPSLDLGSWRCYRCSKTHPEYETSCSCGMLKSESERLYATGGEKEKPANEEDEIVRFKKMLDDGLITEEEFQAKRKKILGI